MLGRINESTVLNLVREHMQLMLSSTRQTHKGRITPYYAVFLYYREED